MDYRRGQKSKGRRWHRGTLLEIRGASICHRQPPPLAVEDSTAQQLGGSPNTLGITLQQQHLFSQEQEAGGDASFYSFYAVLHHTKSSRDRLAQRITPCHKSLMPLKRAAALEEVVAHVSCIYCNASSRAIAGGPPHRAREPSSPCQAPYTPSHVPCQTSKTAVVALGWQPGHGRQPGPELGAS